MNLTISLVAAGRAPLQRKPGLPSGSHRLAVADAKATWRKQRRTYRPWVALPGQHLVVDWAEEAGRNVFCAVLAWSRVRFVHIGPDQTPATTLSLLAECFEELGGASQGMRRIRQLLWVPPGFL